ncbi:MAG: hypothetical protein PVG75_12715 [Thioalkalispiraceae bacterium]|jgi:hypothetical protein
MNLDDARLTHNIAGRYRLRIPARRHDLAYFHQLAETFSEHENVISVSTNSTTAGILIEHQNLDLAELNRFAQQQELFQIRQEEPALLPMFENAITKLQSVNKQIKDVSEDYLDLRATAFVLLVVIGVRQLMQGNLFGPATTLFWYAFQMLMSADKKN